MKQHIEVIKDSFIDYSGKKRHFIIAAVSEVLEIEPIVVGMSSDANIYCNVIGNVAKGVKLGISICNPNDEFKEKVGVMIATGRAMKNTEYALFSTNKGYINTTLVKALLEQEATFLKNNPELYIKGYKEAKDNYFKKKEMLDIKENFTDIEKTVAGELEKDPKFLDDVQKYISWKCKKH